MVHAIIYDNNPEKGGWNLYGRTADFPKAYEPAIRKVGGYFQAGYGIKDTTAIRYAPMGGKYLLSWILRHPAVSLDGDRAYYSVVNFLMDAEDADLMFRIPLTHVHGQVDKIARKLWECGRMVLPNLWQIDMPEQKQDAQEEVADVEDYLLLTGGFYGNDKHGWQMYFQARDPWGELTWLQEYVPYKIRKQISFCVGLESLQESNGTSLNFPTNVSLSQLQRSAGTEGVPKSNKYWHGGSLTDMEMEEKCKRLQKMYMSFSKPMRRMLHIVIDDWHVFGLLADSSSKEKVLRKLVGVIQEASWIAALDEVKLDGEDLKMLNKAITKDSNRRKLKKEVKSRLKSRMYTTDSWSRRANKDPEAAPMNVESGFDRSCEFTDGQKLVAYGQDPCREEQSEENRQDKYRQEQPNVRLLLLRQTKRTACVVAIAAALIAFITFIRQTVQFDSGVTGVVIWYSVGREAALDINKLMGTFLSGVVVGIAGIKLLGSYRK